MQPEHFAKLQANKLADRVSVRHCLLGDAIKDEEDGLGQVLGSPYAVFVRVEQLEEIQH